MTEARARRTLALMAGWGATSALVLASGISPALASPPLRDAYTDVQTRTVDDLCDVPVELVATFSDTRQVDFLRPDGTIRRTTYHIVEQDTFTVGDRTLEGLPYRFNAVIEFDEAGGVTSAISTGQVVRVPLPDGSVFQAAGRVDFFEQQGDFVSVPNSGSSKNLAAFCAALGTSIARPAQP